MPSEKVLNRLGNIAEYKPRAHFVKWHGLIESKEAIAKFYSLRAANSRQFSNYLIEESQRFVRSELEKGVISPRLGLGFAILSEGILNVSLWDMCESTIHPAIYSFIGREDMKRGNIEEMGAFCPWEMAIAAHEAEAWRQYLHSQRTNQDKRQYLENRFQYEVA